MQQNDPRSSALGNAAEHAVQFYEADDYLVDLLSSFVAGGLAAGDAVLTILTSAHSRALATQLESRGLDLSAARAGGRYVAWDAAEILPQIIGADGLDPVRFRALIGGVLADAAAQGLPLRVFGEMVAELWSRGERETALRLEELWTTVAREQPFSLLCAYPLSAFPTADDRSALEAVCAHHARVFPTERYMAISEPDARLRAIADLQQRAQALELEMVDRRAAERALRQRDDLFDTVVTASPTATIIIDPDATVRVWNPAATQLFGWTDAEVIGKPLPIVPAEKRDECARARRAAAEGKAVQELDTYRLHRDGTPIPVAISSAPLDSGRAKTAIVLMFTDLRERGTDEELRARLAAIVESSDDAIVGKSLEGIVLSWNSGAERIFGYTAAEMIGQSITRIVPEERADDVSTILSTIARGERVEHYETERLCKDGRRINISLTVSPIRDSTGRIVGASKIARDVTDRRRVERERQAALRELSTLYAIGQAVSAERNFDRLLQIITDAATDLTGAKFGAFFYNADDPDGGHYLLYTLSGAPREAFDTFGAPRNTAIFAPTFAGVGVVRLDDVRKDPRYGRNLPHRGVPEGHLPVVSYLAVPVVSRSGEVFGGLFMGHPEAGVFTDAAERVVKALAAQLAIAVDNARLYDAEQRARLAAEQANQAKDQFLAMLGHELRNPLSAVQNAVIAAGIDPDRRERALVIARHGTERLTRLVDDLLDVARITQGRVTLQRSPLSLGEVIKRAIEQMRAAFEDQALAITVALPAHDIEVEGDAARLEQVLGNLLANAAKYSPSGGRITLTLEQQGSDAVLSVRDSGVGIPAEVLPRIFDLFVQAPQPLDRTRGGLGIGLTLVKELVELHGGRVSAHSEGPGKGAEFIVRLPATKAGRRDAAAGAEPVLPQRHAERRVLIVEDNADAAESLSMLLELFGLRVRAVGDGPSALEAAAANPPDVMLIDIGLPGMDGYELARRVRADEALRHITLVALTGYGQDEDRQHAFAAGFDYHLVKPVDVDQFRSLVAEIPPSKRADFH